MCAEAKDTYGYVEKVELVGKNITLSAKLDTGAKSASLSAIRITSVMRDGKSYLDFVIPSKFGEIPMSAPYVGKVKIKVRAGEKKRVKPAPLPITRPVVLIALQLGDKIREIPMNLTNRKRFNYPILLGRDAIKAFGGIVDPALVFTLSKETLGKK